MKNKRSLPILAVAILAVSSYALNKTILDKGPDNNGVTVRSCKVTSVHDGDSMRARCPGFKKTIPIRLDQIDAPEIDQAYGIEARDHLRKLCPRGKPVEIHDHGPDTYNRHLGYVFCNGVDVNRNMIASGYAWVYDYYVRDKSLYDAQDKAKAERRGLWASKKKPIAPWDFRYNKKKNR